MWVFASVLAPETIGHPVERKLLTILCRIEDIEDVFVFNRVLREREREREGGGGDSKTLFH